MKAQRGFTLIEVIIAILVLLVGLVAVMKGVPTAMTYNLNNRNDTTAAVIAERVRDLMLRQPIAATTFDDPTGVYPCGTTAICNLGGGAANGDYTAGCTLLSSGIINFAVAPVANYNFTYVDPNDPSGASYSVRWAVVTSVRSVGTVANVPVAKRLVVGVRRQGSNQPAVAMFSSWVSR